MDRGRRGAGTHGAVHVTMRPRSKAVIALALAGVASAAPRVPPPFASMTLEEGIDIVLLDGNHIQARVMPRDGGWYAVLEVPATRTDEAWTLSLLGEDDVLVHPGYFFGFPREAFLVVSLLPQLHLFSDAAQRIRQRVRTA